MRGPKVFFASGNFFRENGIIMGRHPGLKTSQGRKPMLKNILENPIFVKEKMLRARRIREKWYKGLADFAIFPAIVLVPAVVGVVSLAVSWEGPRTFEAMSWSIREMMGGAFLFTAYVLTLYVCYRATTLTYSAVVAEKEKKTYESLIGTLMSCREIVEGKLLASLYPLLVEIGLFSPLLFVFCFGRALDRSSAVNFISPVQIGLFILALLLFAVFFGLVGIFASVTSSTSMRANHKATSILVGFLVLSPILDALCMAFRYSKGAYGHTPFSLSLLVNPLYICSTIIFQSMGVPREMYIGCALIIFCLASLLLYRYVARKCAVLAKE
jgi:hypothetical protein